MKLTKFTYLVAVGLILTVAASGCRKRPGYMTNIPPGMTPKITDNETAAPLKPIQTETAPKVTSADETGGFKLPDPSLRQNWARNSEIFKSDTVYFDFDSSAVKSAEKAKVAAVADYLKANAQDALEIDGHCDERGTEEYNRALGERRALALREDLVRLGIDPNRIDTVTFGKDRPLDPAHNEAAWKVNRRGEFLLEMHPK